MLGWCLAFKSAINLRIGSVAVDPTRPDPVQPIDTYLCVCTYIYIYIYICIYIHSTTGVVIVPSHSGRSLAALAAAFLRCYESYTNYVGTAM